MSTELRPAELASNYTRILDQVNSAAGSRPVTLVAVSKLKPASDIKALYDHGVRHFGENYVQELVAKAKELPQDIKWHFIGALQSGKCKDLARGIPNLYAVETIDSLKKCKKLDAARADTGFSKLNVYLQINTSNEDQKLGYSTRDLADLHETVEYLLNESTALNLQGLMTIGLLAESTADGTNLDFEVLASLKRDLDEKYGLSLALSMGMSNDFVTAIAQGSTSVRVGSSIFGARPPRT